MSSAIEIAATGMRAQQRALDIIAGNVSNINTPAYKRSELRFSELVATSGATASTADASLLDSVAGVGQWSSPMLDAQGQIQSTGNSLDLAIDGNGFVELMGQAGKTLLWRGGTLRILNDGTIATSVGIPLKAGLTVPVDSTALRIDRDGKVFSNSNGPSGEVEIGSLNLVKIGDPHGVERLDGGVFVVRDSSPVTESAAGEDGLGYFVQGSLERSNVDLNSEMIGLIISQRAYGANAQVIRAADELLSIANRLRS